MRPCLFATFVAALATAGACSESQTAAPVPAPAVTADPADLVPFDTGKADGHLFDRDHVIDDFAFEDGAMLGEADIQAFLEDTPYGRRSPLADMALDDGRSVAAHMGEAAMTFGISPLVLLTRMQVEQSLISADGSLSPSRLDKGLGCGCPDDGWCASALSGLSTQLVCAAELLRDYLGDLDAGDATITGWKVGVSKEALDGVTVTPANRATAALYTYTPWTLPYEGGNWLHWNIYRKFSAHAFAGRQNHRWIGGPCASDEDCPFDGGRCWQGGETGVCTAPCEGYCPDALHHPGADTLCADLGALEDADLGGRCLAQCDLDDGDPSLGCTEGSLCVEADRYGEPQATRAVCVPQPQ